MWIAWLSTAIVACGGSRDVTLDIVRDSQPVFVRVRDAGGAWTEPPLKDIEGRDSRFDLGTRAGDFDVLVGCLGPDGEPTSFELLWTTDADDPAWPCPAPAGLDMPPGGSLSVTGLMEEPGTIAMGGMTVTSHAAHWPYKASVDPGVFDLVAMPLTVAASSTGENGRIAIYRSIDVSDSMVGPDVSLVTDGAPARRFAPVFATALDESVSATALWTTAHGTTRMPSVVQDFLAPAASQLDADDRLTVDIQVAGTGTLRGLHADVTDDFPAMPELLPALANAGLFAQARDGGVHAAWVDLVPEYSEVVAVVGGQQLVAARAWIDEHDTRDIQLDASAPGFDTWQVALGTQGGCVEVISQADGLTRTSGTCRP